jgi:hypothetical protein
MSTGRGSRRSRPISDRGLQRAGMFAAAATLAAGAAITLDAGAPVPTAVADPSPPTTTASSAKPEFPSDDQGYLNSAARCDGGQTPLMFGRTSRSLVAVCVGPDGQLQYRGVRLSDEAGLTMAASRSADGAIIATNDDVTYSISPQALLVSEGDKVLYRDTWVEYKKPRFAEGATSTSTSASASPSTSASATTSAESSPPTTTTPTVSTTTVTLKPTG